MKGITLIFCILFILPNSNGQEDLDDKYIEHINRLFTLDSSKLTATINHLPLNDIKQEEYITYIHNEIHIFTNSYSSTENEFIESTKKTSSKKGMEEYGKYGEGLLYILEHVSDTITFIPFSELDTSLFSNHLRKLNDTLNHFEFKLTPNGLFINYSKFKNLTELSEALGGYVIDGTHLFVTLNTRSQKKMDFHVSLWPQMLKPSQLKNWIILYYVTKNHSFFKSLQLEEYFTKTNLSKQILNAIKEVEYAIRINDTFEKK